MEIFGYGAKIVLELELDRSRVLITLQEGVVERDEFNVPTILHVPLNPQTWGIVRDALDEVQLRRLDV